jgi:hypothetical protein
LSQSLLFLYSNGIVNLLAITNILEFLKLIQPQLPPSEEKPIPKLDELSKEELKHALYYAFTSTVNNCLELRHNTKHFKIKANGLWISGKHRKVNLQELKDDQFMVYFTEALRIMIYRLVQKQKQSKPLQKNLFSGFGRICLNQISHESLRFGCFLYPFNIEPFYFPFEHDTELQKEFVRRFGKPKDIQYYFR